MAFTKKIPEWNASGVEPPQSLKDSGWKPGVKPAADHFNWLQTTASEAIKELQQKAGEVKKVNGQLPDANGNVNVNIDTSKLATKEELSSASTYIQQEMNDLEQTVAAHQTDYVQHPGTGTTTNSSNAYAVTLNPAPTSYVANMGVVVTINTDSTGAATLNVNGLGAKSILKSNGNVVSNLKANGVYTVRYNPSANGGTGAFILQGEGGEYGTATSSDVRNTKTFGTENGIVQGTLDLSKLIPDNIKKDVAIDGVVGTLDIESLGGKKWASGQGMTPSTYTNNVNLTYSDGTTYTTQTAFYQVNGLSFEPKLLLCWFSNMMVIYKNPWDYGPFPTTEARFLESVIYSANSQSVYTRFLKPNSYIYVNSTGFSVPVETITNVQINWIAIG